LLAGDLEMTARQALPATLDRLVIPEDSVHGANKAKTVLNPRSPGGSTTIAEIAVTL
jgi:hypothetical protein